MRSVFAKKKRSMPGGVLMRLFVYGTLKRGFWNHEAFCRGALSVEEAVVRGRLYELPSGIPVLKVPQTDVLARGTLDPLADATTQMRLSEQMSAQMNASVRAGTVQSLGPHAAHFAPKETRPQDGGREWAADTPAESDPAAASRDEDPEGDWGPVYGEIMTFDDPESRLPACDRLEGFLPGGSSLYERVLVAASAQARRVLVWLYVDGSGRRRPGRRLKDGVWGRSD